MKDFVLAAVMASLRSPGPESECALFASEGCSALKWQTALRYWDEGKCGTAECPFFKPGRELVRLNDQFVELTPKQRRARKEYEELNQIGRRKQ